MKKKSNYPCVAEVEEYKNRLAEKAKVDAIVDEEPDFIGNAPNYEKFDGWDAERVLAWLNID